MRTADGIDEMKVLLTGGNGMFGRTLVRELGIEFEVIPTDLPEVDVTDFSSVDAALAEYSPDDVTNLLRYPV